MEVKNIFKGLDLINRVPEKLWTEVCDIVQETGIKIIRIEEKCKKVKWLSGEASQIAVKKKKQKAKEKRKYRHLNAEFQRIARRDKKAFLWHSYTWILTGGQFNLSCYNVTDPKGEVLWRPRKSETPWECLVTLTLVTTNKLENTFLNMPFKCC